MKNGSERYVNIGNYGYWWEEEDGYFYLYKNDCPEGTLIAKFKLSQICGYYFDDD